jgi:Protein of unknown function, DUF488
MTDTLRDVFTIGHSSLPYERYLWLLKHAGVTAVADVRTSPRSRQSPQFDRESLERALQQDGIAYVFLGRELGGRPADPNLYLEGVADYEKMAAAESFQTGIQRILAGARKHRIALMCSEHHPLSCHRCLLVGREIARRGIAVRHILSDGLIVNQIQLEDELLEKYGYATDFFAPREERLKAAYRKRAREVAYAARKPKTKANVTGEDLSDSTCCNDRLYENHGSRLL